VQSIEREFGPELTAVAERGRSATKNSPYSNFTGVGGEVDSFFRFFAEEPRRKTLWERSL